MVLCVLTFITNVKEVSVKLGSMKVCYVYPEAWIFLTCTVCIVCISLYCYISLAMLYAGCPYPVLKE